jgi:flavin-dependent dehydrogenase
MMATGLPAIRRVRYVVGGEVTDRTITPRAGIDVLAAPRRHVLDHLLVQAAVEAGATLHTGISVTGVTRSRGRVTGVTGRSAQGAVQLPASVVVGADGLRSRIARAVNAPLLVDRGALGAVHYTYVRRDDWDGFEFHVAEGVMAGVFPTHGGEANVWACTPADQARRRATDRPDGFVATLRHANPELADRVLAGEQTAPVRGAVDLPNHVRQAWGPGWALVGDAGLHRDPITGHGITDALRDAELLARALDGVRRGDLSDADACRWYHDLRHAVAAEVFEATVALAAFPPVAEFTVQQRRATVAMDAEARFLADLPLLPAPIAAAA